LEYFFKKPHNMQIKYYIEIWRNIFTTIFLKITVMYYTTPFKNQCKEMAVNCKIGN
jgi:hypothetical protein